MWSGEEMERSCGVGVTRRTAERVNARDNEQGGEEQSVGFLPRGARVFGGCRLGERQICLPWNMRVTLRMNKWRNDHVTLLPLSSSTVLFVWQCYVPVSMYVCAATGGPSDGDC